MNNPDKDKKFYKDVEQAWSAIFKLSDRLKVMEKLEKTQSILNVLFLAFIFGLIVSQVIIYQYVVFK